ncbi:MAG: HAD-IIB family hydrolase [Sphaerochaetaceae bacterium]|nr:HAD-IIB family hydrolase [Sphaerochaetaceae bacterium]MDC7247058.1 HAD-IIB family hydrolase [Sphaerochaetaceae bacterium]
MYIAMINIHGLLRGENIEMGRDADTGGQTRYVVDLARELSTRDDLQVDIFTRKISDRKVSPDYNRAVEPISDSVKIVRLPCGGKKYIRKEKLWPFLDEYVDYLIEYFVKQKRVPDVIHGHYADGGYIASEIASYFHIPLIFTGHSLGRNKLDYLRSYDMSDEKIEEYYNISKRIAQEERTIANADMVITSTNYEREELYSSYEHRDLDRFFVIPPGLELDKFFPYYHYEISSSTIPEDQKMAQYSMLSEINRFLTNADKPIIMALCRPEARKNIDTLIELYGKSKELQAIANLAIFAGIRDDINTMEEGEKQVLTDMLLLMDRYDLYGKMAIPKHHNPERDVPELYRIVALKQGVFVSAAALENFGLTFIEASAVGLPFIGTDKGGVQDIRKNCDCGLLVDIEKPKQISDAIMKILTDKQLWSTLSEHGVERIREVYNWKSHTDLYLSHVARVIEQQNSKGEENRYEMSMGRRMNKISHLLICDIDNTITGDEEGIKELRELIRSRSKDLGFGVATGRSVESAVNILTSLSFPMPDVLITSVGSEIYYGKGRIQDKGWAQYIRRRWYPEKIKNIVGEFEQLVLQDGDGSQRPFKISYDIVGCNDPERLKQEVSDRLTAVKCPHHVIISHGTFFDILPYRADKGAAVKYISWKWNIEPKSIITAGDSGNDADMLSNPFKGIVVGNHEESLDALRRKRHIYFAKDHHAFGIIEGLKKHSVIPDD